MPRPKLKATRKPTPRPTPAEQPPSQPDDGDHPVVALDSGLMSVITKAELEQLHETAIGDPRSITEFVREATELVTLSEETAGACVYALPRRDNATGTTNMIRGASARFAEILQAAYKNTRVSGYLLRETETEVIARGWFIDTERNNARALDVPRSIVTRSGRRYSREMITTTAKAATSIAMRDAVLQGIPQAIWQPIYKAALKVIAGDTVTLANRRADALAYLAKQGAPAEAVFATLGVHGIEDIGLEELTTLRGLANAIRDEETTIEEAFLPKPPPAMGVAGAKEALGVTAEEPAAE